MSTPQKTPAPTSNHNKSATHPKHLGHVEKLAAFIQHHHLKGDAKSIDGRYFVDVKHDNKHVASHLGMSVQELEASYATLTKDGLIKRHGEHRIEILHKIHLLELSKRAA